MVKEIEVVVVHMGAVMFPFFITRQSNIAIHFYAIISSLLSSAFFLRGGGGGGGEFSCCCML